MSLLFYVLTNLVLYFDGSLCKNLPDLGFQSTTKRPPPPSSATAVTHKSKCSTNHDYHQDEKTSFLQKDDSNNPIATCASVLFSSNNINSRRILGLGAKPLTGSVNHP